MRITIKIDSASVDDLRALQQSLTTVCGVPPHRIIPGSDAFAPTAVYAWAMGPESWSACTPPVVGDDGISLLLELARRLDANA